MARIPEKNNSALSLPTTAVDESQAGGVGRLLQGVGDMGRGIAREEIRRDQQEAAMRAKEEEERRKEEEKELQKGRVNDAALLLNEYKLNRIGARREILSGVEDNVNYGEFVQNVNKTEEEALKGFLSEKGVEDEGTIEILNESAGKERLKAIESLVGDVERVRKEKRQLRAEEQIGELQREASQFPPDSQERWDILELQSNAVDVLVREDIISAERALSIKESNLQELDSVDAQADLRDNPSAFLKNITDAENYPSLSPQDRQRFQFEAQAEIRSRVEREQKRIEKQNKLLESDPAAYVDQVLGISPNPLDRIAAQKSLGVAGVNIRAFTKREASVAADKINSIKDPKQLKGTIDSVLNTIEDETARDIAFRDLEKAGLNGNARFMGYIPDTEPGIINAWADVMEIGEKEVMERAKAIRPTSLFGINLSSILDEDINENFSDYFSTINVNGANIGQINQLTQKAKTLAGYFITKGDSTQEASQKATRWITDSYEYPEYNGVTYRIPKDINAKAVEEFADERLSETVKKAASGKLVNPFPSVATGLYDTEIEDNTVWVTNSNEDGLVLMHKTGFVIEEEVDGVLQPVTAGFSDAVIRNSEQEKLEGEQAQARKRNEARFGYIGANVVR